MSNVITKNKILNILDSQGKSYIKMYDFRGNLLWNKDQGGGGEWVLQESDYIIGTDGKYYQKLLDVSKAVDNNPVPDLNGEWVEDTVSGSLNIDSNFDYYMSNSNYHVANSYSQFKVQWSGLTSMTFLYRSYAESSFDYLVINGLDKPAFTSLPSSSTSGILAHTNNKQTKTYNTITIECDEGEHFIWFAYRKDSSGDTSSDRSFVGIPNNLISVPEDAVKKGPELRYEYIKSNDVVITRPGYGCFKYYKHYYTPDESKDLITEDYILGEEEPLTPITRDYLRFDATDGDLHIGVNNLSKFTNLEYSIGFDETWTTFTIDGVDISNGSSLYLRGGGTSTSSGNRTFTTSVPCECHGNVMSLLNKDTFETLKTCTNYCFYGLFNGGMIKTSPTLPSTTLKSNCYNSMFYGCALLVNTPELPATTLTTSCYQSMFQGCTSLTTIPENLLPATTLADNCYQSMFYGCSKLVNVPELPATTLASSCYYKMFSGCSSLVNAPELPATKNKSTFDTSCYNSMFYGCTSLVNVPSVLPITTLTSSCYQSMFQGCTSLTTIPENLLPATTLASGCYNGMFYGCSKLVNVPELPATTLASSCYYNMFNACSSLVNAPELPATTLVSSCYQYMFYGCTSLVNVPSVLPATTLASSCYIGMFQYCTSLTTIPENLLPATTLASDCYQSMFYGCTKLVNAPELPATTLANSCYYNMFSGCSSLVNAPSVLPATTLTNNCYQTMFQGCTKLVNTPSVLPATTLTNNCYQNMFYGCSSLVNAPELPATTLANNCYSDMFHGCDNLTSVKCNIRYKQDGTEITNSIGTSWLLYVKSIGTFYKNPDWAGPTVRNNDTIPDSWTIEDWVQ